MMHLRNHESACMTEELDKISGFARHKDQKDQNIEYFNVTLIPDKWLNELNTFSLKTCRDLCVGN